MATKISRNFKFKGADWNKTGRDFQIELMKQVDKVNKAGLKVLTNAQQTFIDGLPNHEEEAMPFITGNLHDSIASVISMNGRVVRASQTAPVATEVSVLSGREVFAATKGVGRKRIVGSTYARNAVRTKKYPGPLAATMIVAVPYAEIPNKISDANRTGKHVGYLDTLAAKYYRAIENAFRATEALKMFKWRGSTLLPQRFTDAIIRGATK